jgi:hypothetical protein
MRLASPLLLIASFILAFTSLPQEAGATNLVTWDFSGIVDESTVSDISVGTTFTGTLSYDSDVSTPGATAPDRA